jgi:osmotically-inducible protein OsmY
MKTKFRLSLIHRFLFAFFILAMVNISIAMIPQKDKMTEQMMKTFVEYRLIKSKLLVNDNISVTVANRIFTLDGTVSTLRDKEQAEKEVHKVDENYQVINNLIIPKSNLSDPDFAKRVTEQLRKHIFYSIFDWVTVSANNGVVTLKGWTHLPWGDTQFVQEIEKIPGVLGVKNEIQHELGSDELRYIAARLIYNDMRFENYAYDQDPPIHIIVIGSKVILQGIVQSDSDKSWAETLLRFTPEIGLVENNLIVENNY